MGDNGSSGELLTTAAIGEWRVEYSRFFNFPDPSPYSFPSIHLRRLPPCKTRSGGTWMNSSCPSLLLRLAKLHPAGVPVLSVSIPGGVTYEEHYVSDLNLTWPQLSCASQCPVKGSRVLFVSFTRSSNQIEKFAVRFATRSDVVSFLDSVKQNSNDIADPGESDVASGGSPVSEILTSNGIYGRVDDKPSDEEHATSLVSKDVEEQGFSQPTVLTNTQTDPNCMPSSFNQVITIPSDNEVTNENSPISEVFTSNGICDGPDGENAGEKISSLSFKDAEKEESQQPSVATYVGTTANGLPPSFTELVASCSADNGKGADSTSDTTNALEKPIPEATMRTITSEVEKYVSDDSFMDMVARLESVITELGGDLPL